MFVLILIRMCGLSMEFRGFPKMFSVKNGSYENGWHGVPGQLGGVCLRVMEGLLSNLARNLGEVKGCRIETLDRK